MMPTTPRRSGDVLNTVRKWDLHFEGQTNETVMFLERLEELRDAYAIPREELLRALPELLKGSALLWYRNNKSKWRFWHHFEKDFRRHFLPQDFELRMEEEIRSRTQGAKEKARDYLTAMQTLIRRHGNCNERAELARIYRNLRPEYKSYIRVRDFSTIEELVQLTEEFEQLQTETSAFRPPPKPAQAYIAETAYKEPEDTKTQKAPGVVRGNPGRQNFEETGAQRIRPEPRAIMPSGSEQYIPNYDKERNCQRCGDASHSRTRCNNKARIFCWTCGKLNVFTKSCHPYVKTERNAAPLTSPDTLEASCEDVRPRLVVEICGAKWSALVDTGACWSHIGDRLAATLRAKKIVPTSSGKVRLANGKCVKTCGNFTFPLTTRNGQRWTIDASHLPPLQSDLILGMNSMIKMQAVIDTEHRVVSLGEEEDGIGKVSDEAPTTPSAKPDLCLLSSDEHERLEKFLEEEFSRFSTCARVTQVGQHHIRLTDTTPIKQRHRPLNPAMQAVANRELDEMLEKGVVEPSESPYSSPIVLIPKKDGSYRFCVDYRAINQVSQKDAYPLPQIPAILDKLRDTKYVSSLDLRHGYWQIPLTNASKPITAFTVPGRGLYQFTVMPFGLHAAPSTFQRVLDQVIGPEVERSAAYAYLDDIVVLGGTFDEHLDNLRRIFDRLRRANFRLNREKCRFAQDEVTYLGHTVNQTGLHTSPDKVEAISKFAAPRSRTELRRFLGMVSWYRRFIQDFSTTAEPLNRLLQKKRSWSWTDEQQDSFEKLKKALTEAPILNGPDFEAPFFLQTDASDYGLGACLFQKIQGQDSVVAFASRSLNTAEKKYSATEKECLAIVYGVEKMRPYLEGYHFTVLSDHQSLKWLHNLKNPSGRLARWVMRLQQYDFHVEYRKGALNQVADALSREPVEPAPQEECLAIEEVLPPCKWYDRLRRNVEANPGEFPEYSIQEGRLFRHIWHRTDLKDTHEREAWKQCVPVPLRVALIRENHDEPTAGHAGIAKTISRLARKYYWPGMFRDVARYVRGCETCLRYKASQQQTPGQMKTRCASGPFSTLCMDLVGPLPRSKKGYVYLLVMQDRFTKWVEVQALRKATTKTVGDALREKIIMRYGSPRAILTDGGPQFVSKEFRDLLSLYGIRKLEIAPYSPQANPVERMNRVIKTAIAQYCENVHENWDQYLNELTFAFNSVPHTSTGFSPAYLNLGREIDLPSKTMQDPVEGSEESIEQRTKDLGKITEMYELVKLIQLQHSEQQAKYYNRQRRDWRPEVGTYVMLKTHPLSSAVKKFSGKLAPKYSGPFLVEEHLAPQVMRLVDNQARSFQAHVKDLKPARLPGGGDDAPSTLMTVTLEDPIPGASVDRPQRHAMDPTKRVNHRQKVFAPRRRPGAPIIGTPRGEPPEGPSEAAPGKKEIRKRKREPPQARWSPRAEARPPTALLAEVALKKGHPGPRRGDGGGPLWTTSPRSQEAIAALRQRQRQALTVEFEAEMKALEGVLGTETRPLPPTKRPRARPNAAGLPIATTVLPPAVAATPRQRQTGAAATKSRRPSTVATATTNTQTGPDAAALPRAAAATQRRRPSLLSAADTQQRRPTTAVAVVPERGPFDANCTDAPEPQTGSVVRTTPASSSTIRRRRRQNAASRNQQPQVGPANAAVPRRANQRNRNRRRGHKRQRRGPAARRSAADAQPPATPEEAPAPARCAQCNLFAHPERCAQCSLFTHARQ